MAAGQSRELQDAVTEVQHSEPHASQPAKMRAVNSKQDAETSGEMVARVSKWYQINNVVINDWLIWTFLHMPSSCRLERESAILAKHRIGEGGEAGLFCLENWARPGTHCNTT